MISQPTFLVGAERSGTTLLRLMLDENPQLAWNMEFEYAVDLMTEQGGFPDLQAYHRYLAIDRIFQSSGFALDTSLTYPELIDSFLEQKRTQSNKRLVGATVHRHFDRLLRIWPDARFVHLVRDGRDVARSVIEMGWAGNLWTGCNRWIDAEQLWEKMSRNLAGERQLTVRFEDLLQDPVSQLTRICAFCNASYSPTMLEYPKHTTYELPNPKTIASWKRKSSEDDIRLVESRIGPMLAERGYELSNLAPLFVTPKMARRLLRQDYWGRLRFRLRKYGFTLLLKRFLARRLGLQRWNNQIQLQVNALENDNLK